MTGTHVSANQGGCTCWCDDCGESHNCESWSETKTLRWLAAHRRECPAGRQKRIRESLDALRLAGVPEKVLVPIQRHADSLAKGSV